MYVTPATVGVSKTTELNSAPARFAPANVIVCEAALAKVTVPVPAAHDAEVLAFVQEPETVQDSEPNAM